MTVENEPVNGSDQTELANLTSQGYEYWPKLTV